MPKPPPPENDWGIVQVEIPEEEVIEEAEEPYTRLCNKCNKVLSQCVGEEARCKNCGGVEFRLE